MKEIRFLDLGKQLASIKKQSFSAFNRVYDSAAFSSGPFVEAFEKNFARFCGARHAVAVNSGTSALHLAMIVLGVGKGDEVIVPANTFIATAWCVSYVGATPVFADCLRDTWEIDPAQVRAKITRRTKAVIGVHLNGQPFDVDAVKAIARKHKIFLVEDAAQAHGARYRGRPVGVLGDIGCFSFYPGKNLGACGEGGAIVTNNPAHCKRLQSLRNHGSAVRYHHDELGFNYRMGGFEGASLDVKLKHLGGWNRRRQAIAAYYRDHIRNGLIRLQHVPRWADPVHHLMVAITTDREKLTKHLQAHGIIPGRHYPVPCHLQKAYAHLGYKRGDCPNAEYLADRCLTLPMFAELTQSEVKKIVMALNRYPG